MSYGVWLATEEGRTGDGDDGHKKDRADKESAFRVEEQVYEAIGDRVTHDELVVGKRKEISSVNHG